MKTVPETLPERVLLGMMRTPQPPGVEYIREDGSVSYCDFVLCPCGDELWDQKQRIEHWLQGHFDEPVYATKQEMIDRAIFRQPLLGQDDDPNVERTTSGEATASGEAKP